MLIKKIGGILLFRLKFYKLIKILTLPLIITSLLLPFMEWNLTQNRQKYNFQEPSLRTKIFDLNFLRQDMAYEIEYLKIAEGIQTVKFQGRSNNQCILITYPENFSQSNAVKMLYHTIKNDNNLAKNVVLLSYRNINALKNIFYRHLVSQQPLHFGTIRIALNLDNHLRNKQKSKPNQIKAFLQTYGKSGIRSDVDNFQSLKQLLERFHIEWSSCQQIHEMEYLKMIRKSLSSLNHYIPGLKSRVMMFVDNLLCQGYRSFLKNYQKSHEILMQNGFQSSLVTFLTNEMTLENSQKISKFSYSFIKEYSMQQDHLHSSQTFYYPISNNFYLNLMGTIYGGLIFLIVGMVNSIGFVVQNSQRLTSSFTFFNLIEICLFGFQVKIYGNLNVTMIYLLMKLVFKWITGKFILFKTKQNHLVDLEFTLVTGISFLISLHFTIFNFSLFYLSALSSSLLLAKSKKLFFLVIVLSLWAYFGLNIDTIKSQVMTLNMERMKFIFISFVQTLVEKVQIMSLQAKISVIPLLYGFSTFLQ